MDNMDSDVKPRRVFITVEAEIVQRHEGATTYNIITGFGDPQVPFCDSRVLAATEVPAA